MNDILEIAPPLPLPSMLPWMLGAPGAILALLLVSMLFRLWKARQQKAEPPLLPHEIALRDLEAAKSLMDPARSPEYASVVSGILRRYIETAFSVSACAETSEQFLERLTRDSSSLIAAHYALLRDFLTLCDAAKFAKAELSAALLDNLHESARRFVQATNPSGALQP